MISWQNYIQRYSSRQQTLFVDDVEDHLKNLFFLLLLRPFYIEITGSRGGVRRQYAESSFAGAGVTLGGG